MRKLYLDFDLSSYQLAEITGWSKTSICDFFRLENIFKEVKKSPNPKFGERNVGGGIRVPHQNEQKIIQKILTLKSNNKSFREIANILNDGGFFTKQSCKWTISTVYEMYRREKEKKI